MLFASRSCSICAAVVASAFLLGVAVPSPAFAQKKKTAPKVEAPDIDPPVITHTQPPADLQPGKVKVEFKIEDRSALFGVLFHWRHVGDTNYRAIDYPSAQTAFSAEFEVTKDFEFWIEAYDEAGNGPALDGSAETPHLVTLAPQQQLAFDTLDAQKDTPPPPPPPPADERHEDLTRADVVAGPQGPFRISRVSRVQVARNIPPKMMEARVAGGLQLGGDFLYPNASISGQSMFLAFAYAPIDIVQVGLGVNARRTGISAAGAAGAALPKEAASLSDIILSARAYTPPVGPLRFGLEGALEMPRGLADYKFPDAVEAERRGFVVSPRLTGLATFEHEKFRAHVNAGYFWDESQNILPGQWGGFTSYALGLSRYDALSFSLAGEFPIGQIVPFAEYSIDIPVDRSSFSACTPDNSNPDAPKTCGPGPELFPAAGYQIPQRLGLGARYEISPLMGVDLTFEASLTSAGRGNADVATGSILPLEGLAPPPPFALRLNFVYQFGAPPEAAYSPSPDLALTPTPDAAP